MLKKLGFNKVIMMFIIFNVILGAIIGTTFLTSNKKSVKDLSTTSTWGIDQLKQKSSVLKSIALVHSNVLPTIAEKDAEVRAIRLDVINGFTEEVKKTIKLCGDSCKEISEQFAKYESDWKVIYDNNVAKGDVNGAITGVLEKLNPTIETTFDLLDKKLTATEKQASQELQDAIIRGEKTNQILNVMIFVFCIITFVAGVIFQKAVSKTLHRITSSLTDTIEITREISNKINQGITKISNATNKQASAVHETSATAEHLASIVDTNTQTAKKSQQSSEVATQAAGVGQTNMKQMNEVMQDFNSNNNEIVGTLEKVNIEFGKIVTVINEIENKTKVINEIVFQTRLLSFNASVEAARAGEAGKGFAVVAEEVGNLAQNSGKAAQEITAMLDNSKKIVNDIVNTNKQSFNHIIEKGQSSIKQGNSTAEQCNRALDEILKNANSVQGMISEVADSSIKQSEGLKEVLKAMGDLDNATQENSATSEEFAVTATELQAQSDELQKLADELFSVVNGNLKGNKSNSSTPHHEDTLTQPNQKYNSAA